MIAPADRPWIAQRLPIAVAAACGTIALAAAAVAWRHGSVAPLLAAGLGVIALLIGLAILLHTRERRRLRWLDSALEELCDDPASPFAPPADPELSRVIAHLLRIRRLLRQDADGPDDTPSGLDDLQSISWTPATPPARTSIGTAGAAGFEATFDPTASGIYTTLDMVNRLHPETLRWLDSSPAEQDFLGYTLSQLKNMSLIDILQPDHRHLAREQLRGAILKGEAHGLIYRIRNARGEPKAIEMNVSVRLDGERRTTHLRCHVTDVTAKLQAGRELRRRTRELVEANEDLVEINGALAELKNRFSDLYQNAPIMYYSLDVTGIIIECNKTMLQTLGYRRGELIGGHYVVLLSEEDRSRFPPRHAELIRTGSLEVESRWIKSDGTAIDVWLTATAVMGADGSFLHSRCVSRDVTARKQLEAELQEKNARLGRANDELSRKNKELDEFTHVVSHDLQEPLRTIIAFSDFLMKDYGERLNEEGKEYVRFLVDASRRMRSLIHDVLRLSRAGEVTGELAEVDMNELVATVRADLSERIRVSGAEVSVEGPLPAVWGDRIRLGQLFTNLLANGLKYNRSEQPRVTVRARCDHSSFAEFAVTDNGIGIAPEFHAKVFQFFRRLHTREEYEGTGAGLAICEKIVRAHGGTIRVESALGQGSTFFLMLPKTRPNPPSVNDPEHPANPPG
jgi:PAS domain S-box-containing protein